MRMSQSRLKRIINEELRSTQAILNEGIIEDYGSEIVQFAIGAAAEYGLGAVTLPAAGAGLAVGPAANTVVDGAFAAKSVAGIASMLGSFSSQAGEFSGLVDDIKGASSLLAKDTDAFYQRVKSIIEKIIGYTGGTVSAGIIQQAAKIKVIIKKMITSLIEPITKGIKLIIPDAAIGSGISATIVTALRQIDRHCFDVVVSAVKSLPGAISKFILDPNAAPEFLKQVIPVLSKFFKDFSQKIEDTSWFTTAVASLAVGPLAPIIKQFGPAGFNSMADMLKSNKDTLISAAQTVTSVAIPVMFGFLAAWQVIMTQGFIADDDKEAPATAGETKKEGIRKRAIMQNESVSTETGVAALRILIREELSVAGSPKKPKRHRNS
jgi:hypothetical protein